MYLAKKRKLRDPKSVGEQDHLKGSRIEEIKGHEPFLTNTGFLQPQSTFSTISSMEDEPNSTTERQRSRGRRLHTRRIEDGSHVGGDLEELNYIKREEVEATNWTRNADKAEKVKIYVGPNNRVIVARRNNLESSPVLKSYISEDEHHGAYIMKPQLLSVNYQDFGVVVHFIHKGELPSISEASLKSGHQSSDTPRPQVPPTLSIGLVQTARIYLLAKQFRVNDMVKSIQVQVIEIPNEELKHETLIEFASIILNDNATPGSTTSTNSSSRESAITMDTQLRDPLEQWVINNLARSIRGILNTQQEAFWKMVTATSRCRLLADVLEKVASDYRVAGTLPDELVVLD